MENNKQILLKPAEYAEKHIIKNIVSGHWKSGQPLPPERVLAQQLGITRPTLRETLKRLATEGWISIQHGKPTIVNDFIKDGSIGLIKTLIKHCDIIPEPIIADWLEFRAILLPELTQKAIDKDKDALLSLLSQKPLKNDNAEAYAIYDWKLQAQIVNISGNSIARLIFNDVKEPYLFLAKKYFSIQQNKNASFKYYQTLEHTIKQNPDQVPIVVKKAMIESIANYANIIKILATSHN